MTKLDLVQKMTHDRQHHCTHQGSSGIDAAKGKVVDLCLNDEIGDVERNEKGLPKTRKKVMHEPVGNIPGMFF
jgi:hypothetical protein